MSTVAEQLRSAREAKGLTVYQVAETTKIRTDHIRALEEGNFEMFSAPVYIRGSVKNCAMLLKLDVPAIMAELNVELGQTEKFKEPPKLMEESNTPLDHVMFLLSKLNWRVGLIGGAALVVLLIVFFVGMTRQHHSHKDSLTGLQPAVYQSAGSTETLPLPTHH